jgi:polygalacturonase
MLDRRFAAFLILFTGVGIAQDQRNVTEPKIPPSCVKLEAGLAAVGDKLREEDEQKLDTERLQKAIDGCGAGKAVELAGSGGKNAFLSGPLEMREGVTLLVDKGVTLYGSRDAAVYEYRPSDTVVSGPGREPASGALSPGLCGTIAVAKPAVFPAPPAGALRGGCRPLISIMNVKNVGIMGDGVIDGRGYARLLGKDYSWWQMARKAEPTNARYYSTRLIVAGHADGLVLYRITLHNSPNFHVSVGGTNGFTAWGVHLQTPTDKSLDARNTDGIDPGNSTNVTVAHSWIDNGDDNIAIKTGVSHMSVLDNHFYSGHGMSIGSETYSGQSYLLVDGLVEDHTTSGIRIKSNVTRGGLVHDLTYRNICMRNVPIPIAISPYYTNQTTEPFEDPKYKGDRIPDYKAITLENIFSESAGNVLIAGLDDAHRTEVTLQGVVIKGITASQVHLNYTDLKVLPPGTNIPFAEATRTNKTVKVQVGGGNEMSLPGDGADACADKFVPMQ